MAAPLDRTDEVPASSVLRHVLLTSIPGAARPSRPRLAP
jgi:hypothetical protein